MKRRLTFVILASLATSAFARAESTATPYAQQVEWFFTALRAGHTDEAAEGIYASNEWIKMNTDQVAKLKSGLQDLPASLGDFLGYERVTEEQLGKRFVHLDYAVYFERRPIRIFFEFYRSKAGWVTQAVGLADDIPDWSKQRARTRYLESNEH